MSQPATGNLNKRVEKRDRLHFIGQRVLCCFFLQMPELCIQILYTFHKGQKNYEELSTYFSMLVLVICMGTKMNLLFVFTSQPEV